jgi:hypothetical protein
MRSQTLRFLGALLTFAAFANPLGSAFGSPPSGTPLMDEEFAVVTRVYFDEPGDGAIWARGSTYKAKFTSEGFTYFPFFGSAAPRHFPVAFTTLSAKAGAVDLGVDGPVAPVRVGDAVIYDRGAVLERYDLAPEGVEQTFVVKEAAAEGDLALRIGVESELAVAGGMEGIDFIAEGLGLVRYGLPFAFDANGAPRESGSTFQEGAIELRVPAGAFAASVLPLTIDPLVTTFSIDSTPLDRLRADVSYDASTDRFLVVYEEVVNASDSDIFSRELSGNGALIPGSDAYIDVSSGNWRDPKVANLNAANVHLVVAEVVFPLGVDVIAGRIRAAGSVTVGNVVQISLPSPGVVDDYNPDVGGDANPFGPSYFLVVWETDPSSSTPDHDITARLVTSTGTLAGLGPILLSAGPEDDRNPSVSKSNGTAPASTQDWTVAWERPVGLLNSDIYGARVHWNGTVSSPPFAIDTSSGSDTDPTVSSPTDDTGAGRTYLVAYERSSLIGSSSIQGKIFSGSGALASASLSGLATPSGTTVHRNPSVDSDGCRFAVSWSRQDASNPSDFDVVAATFHLGGGTIALSEGGVFLANSLPVEDRPEVASIQSGGTSSPRYMVVWDKMISSSNHDIEGALYDGTTGDGGHVTVGTGCGGIDLVPSGTPALGQPVSYAMNGSSGTPLLFLGLPQTPPTPLCAAGCSLGVVFSPILMIQGSTFSTTIPCQPALLGGQVALQGARIGDGGGCTSPLVYTVSHTVVTTIE